MNIFIIQCIFDKQVNGSSPWVDMTLAELQEMAARQQQQIDKQQQVLSSKVQNKTKFYFYKTLAVTEKYASL